MLRMTKEKLKNKIEKANKEYKEKYGSNTSPWEYFSLTLNEDTKDTYWLNPRHQQHCNAGWYHVNELQDWLGGFGSIFKETHSYKHLDLMCRINKMSTILWSYYRHFNFIEPGYPKFNLSDATDEDGNLNKDFTCSLEAYLKQVNESVGIRIPKRTTLSSSIDKCNLVNKFLTNDSSIISMQHSIYTLLQFLTSSNVLHRKMSYYSNTPEIRENGAWWTDVIMYEIIFEAIKESGVYTEEEMEYLIKHSPYV